MQRNSIIAQDMSSITFFPTYDCDGHCVQQRERDQALLLYSTEATDTAGILLLIA